MASELHRRLNFKTDRASVRRWALAQQLAPDTRSKAAPKPVKRWQARDYGARWQYDASPHAWRPGCRQKQALLGLLDDATRYPERFAQEALGHNSKAVHRAYAKRALVKIPSLEEYEKRRAPSAAVAVL